MSTTTQTGHLDMVATALDPLHHGAGTIGNVQVLRTQAVILDDGSEARIPFVSGNSIKHLLRDGGARFAIEALGIENGALSKGMVDLLWSGGGLTKGGSAVSIGKARELERLFPLLAVLGYGAGNTMTASKLRVDHLHLVCAENAWRMPAALLDTPHARLLAGEYQGEEFGTRHDALRDPTASRVLDVQTRTMIEGERSDKAKDKSASEKVRDSAQMIYEFETVKAGARFWGRIGFRDLTPLEVGALQASLGRSCQGMHGDAYVYHLGAKAAVGFGRLAVSFTGSLRHIARPVENEADALTRFGADAGAVSEYLSHLRENRAAIIDAIREAAE